MEIAPQKYKAPEIYGDHWFNAEPLPISAQKGSVILLVFWDLTCQQCKRGFPYVKEWFRRYSDIGLIIIGVHTPKFPFEKDPIYVEKAIRQNEINYPVVMDNEYFIHTAYRVRTVPSHFIIDKSGFIRYIQEGEGSYAATESSIQSLLKDAGYYGDFPFVMEPVRDEDRPGIPFYRATPEILVGYQHSNIGNTEGYFPQAINFYTDPGIYLEGRVYLHGNWFINKYFVKLENDVAAEGYITFVYNAKEVGVVLNPEGEKGFQVFVSQDGNFLTQGNAGKDIKFDDDGKSFLIIDEPKLFHVVNNHEHGEHNLKLVSRSNGFAFYGASFVPAPIQELIS